MFSILISALHFYNKNMCCNSIYIFFSILLLHWQETLEKVDKWMTKYDKDMEGIDLKIHVKKNDYQNTLDKRIYLENTVR